MESQGLGGMARWLPTLGTNGVAQKVKYELPSPARIELQLLQQ